MTRLLKGRLEVAGAGSVYCHFYVLCICKRRFTCDVLLNDVLRESLSWSVCHMTLCTYAIIQNILLYTSECKALSGEPEEASRSDCLKVMHALNSMQNYPLLFSCAVSFVHSCFYQLGQLGCLPLLPASVPSCTATLVRVFHCALT